MRLKILSIALLLSFTISCAETPNTTDSTINDPTQYGVDMPPDQTGFFDDDQAETGKIAWKEIGTKINKLFMTKGQLYGIHSDNKNVMRYNSTEKWEQIGQFGQQLHGQLGILYALTSDKGANSSVDRKIWEYKPKDINKVNLIDDWLEIGIDAIQIHTNETGSNVPTVYAITSGGQLWSYDGIPKKWTQIGQTATNMSGYGRDVYAVTNDQKVWKYSGTPLKWDEIGKNGKSLHATSEGLYMIDSSNNVFKYKSGTDWEKIGENASMLHGEGSKIYTVVNGEAMKYDGSPLKWSSLEHPAREIYSYEGNLFIVDKDNKAYKAGVAVKG